MKTSITLLLDTGSQITTLNSEAAQKVLTATNNKPANITSITANGNLTQDFTEINLRTEEGQDFKTYYSPNIKTNLMSLDTLTQQLHRTAIITQNETYLIEKDSDTMKSIENLIANSPDKSQIKIIKNTKSLIPITLTFQETLNESATKQHTNQKNILEQHAQLNALTQLPYSRLLQEPSNIPLVNNLKLTPEDKAYLHLHNFNHYQPNKLKNMLSFPMSYAAIIAIKECHTCKMKNMNKKKRSSRPIKKNEMINQRTINHLVNPNFTYSAHLDTIKIEEQFQSDTVKSFVTVVLKPVNYVHLIPISTSQPTQEEVYKKVTQFFVNIVMIPPTTIILDRGNEFNRLLTWAQKQQIQTQIAATGDSQFNGVVERFNKEIKIQYGLITAFIPTVKIKYFNHIIASQIMIRLNSDRRNLPHSPNYYMFSKDVSERYINTGVPLFSDIKVQTHNGDPRTGIHLGYDLATNRTLVHLRYKNQVPYKLQAIHHSNMSSLHSYNFVTEVTSEILFTPEFQTESNKIIASIMTPTQLMFPHFDRSTINYTEPINIPTQYNLLLDVTTLNETEVLMINSLQQSKEQQNQAILQMLENNQHVPIKTAMKVPEIRSAMTTEIKKWLVAEAITPTFTTNPSSPPKFVTTFWILSLKKTKQETKVKARLITIERDTVNTRVLPEHYSPVANKLSISALIHKALSKNLELATLDVTGAFLQAPTSHDLLLMKAPTGYNELTLEIQPDYKIAQFYKVQKALYGLKDSPLQWYKMLIQNYQNDNFTTSELDKCLITSDTNPNVSATIHVDDILYILDPEDTEDKVLGSLSKRKLQTTSNKSHNLTYLGIQYTRNKDKVEISLENYLNNLHDENISTARPTQEPVPRYFSKNYEIIKALHKGTLTQKNEDIDQNPLQLTINASSNLSQYNNEHIKLDFQNNQKLIQNKFDNLNKEFKNYTNNNSTYILTIEDFQKYLGIVGYITSIHRHELAIYHLLLSSFNVKYSEHAAHALQHLVSYIFSTKEVYHVKNNLNLNNQGHIINTYTDANWSRFDKSYSGVVITINDELILTKAKKQTALSTSTFTAELSALYFAVTTSYETVTRYKEAIDLPITNIIIHCDNKAVIHTITSTIPLNSTIIINNLIHKTLFLRKEYQANRFNIQYIQSKANPADLFTKPLGKLEFQATLKLPQFTNNIRY